MSRYPTAFRGVRYREHPTRRLKNGQPDQYFTIRYKANGVQHHEPIGWASEGWTEEQANEERAIIRRNIRRGERPQSLKEKREMAAAAEAEALAQGETESAAAMTFGDLATLWLQETGEGTRSTASDRSRLNNHVLPLIGSKRLDALDVITLRNLAKSLARRHTASAGKGKQRLLSEETVHHCLRAVRRIVRWAQATPVSEGSPAVLWPWAYPFAGFSIPRPTSRRLRVLTYAEAEAWLKAALEYGRTRSRLGDPLLVHDLVLSGLHCGARISERVTLTRERFLWDQGQVAVLDTKTGLDRLVPLDREFTDMARRRLADGRTWLFQGRDGQALRPDSASSMVEKSAAVFNEGVTDRRMRVTDHTCRHSYATWLLLEGEDIYTVAEILGHESLDTTRRYLKFVKGLQERASGRISGKIRSQAATPEPGPDEPAGGKVISIKRVKSHRSP